MGIERDPASSVLSPTFFLSFFLSFHSLPDTAGLFRSTVYQVQEPRYEMRSYEYDISYSLHLFVPSILLNLPDSFWFPIELADLLGAGKHLAVHLDEVSIFQSGES